MGVIIKRFISGMGWQGWVLVLAFGLGSCSGRSPAVMMESAMVVVEGGGGEPADAAGVEDEIVARINAFRHSRGKDSLRRHGGLDRLAAIHSGDMMRRGKMSHRQYHYRQFVAEEGYELENLIENVMRGRGIPDSELGRRIVGSWIESGAHRGNLLAPNESIGVAVVRGADGSVYATQLSARPRNEYVPQPGGPMILY